MSHAYLLLCECHECRYAREREYARNMQRAPQRVPQFHPRSGDGLYPQEIVEPVERSWWARVKSRLLGKDVNNGSQKPCK